MNLLLIQHTQEILKKINELDQKLYKLCSDKEVICPNCNKYSKLFPAEVEELLIDNKLYIKVWCNNCKETFKVRALINFDGIKKENYL